MAQEPPIRTAEPDATGVSSAQPSAARSVGQGLTKWLVVPLVAGSMGIGVAVGATAVATALSGADQPARVASQGSQDTLRQLELFADVLARVRADYVVQVEDEKLIEGALNGMLQSLDPHSGYLNNDGLNSMQEATRGEYGGLGLEVSSQDGAVRVITPMDDSPGARAGIKAGDLIIAIDGTSILGQPLDQQVRQMRGRAGTSITVTVVREGEDPVDIPVTRAQIVTRPVTWRMEENDVAYVRISTFVNENTADALDKALDDIQAQHGAGLKGMIIDLRNNGGGLLDQAIEIVDMFTESGEVVSTRGRRADDIQRFFGTPGQRLASVPMVVLINEGSASASEIVAGALQDRRRATIVGMASFGKGSVQTVIPLNQGRDGALRLTTARYYTPAGRSIQGAGIEPNIEIAARRITEEDLARRTAAFRGEETLSHALDNDTGARRRPPHMPADMPPADWKDEDDYQLKRAVALLKAGLPPPPGSAPLQAAAPPAARQAQAPAPKDNGTAQ
jgi:carboxyl-terminal processing protease